MALDLSPELRAAVDAVRGALDDAGRRLERAQHFQQTVTATAIAALRQRGLTDSFIGQVLDIDADTRAAAADGGPADGGAHDWELRAEIEQLWMVVRRKASVWMQIDEVTTSAQVVQRNRIDTGSWPLASRALDSPGAEFVHRDTGQKIVVYALQGRDGTPHIVDNAIASWDHQGEYDIEFISRDGVRSPMDLSPFGVLSATRKFRRPTRRDLDWNAAFRSAAAGGVPGRDAAESFAAAVAAIRGSFGPLPPYSEVADAVSDEVANH